MTQHEPTIRKLSTSPLVGERFQQFIQRWEINRNPPPPEELQPKPPSPRRIASHLSRMEEEAEEDYLIGDDWGSDDVLGEDDAPPMIHGHGTLGNSPIASSKPMRFPTLKRKAGFRPLTPTPTPPRTPIMGTLADYGEEEEEGGSPSSTASTSATSPEDMDIPQREPEDEEDMMLEALVSRKVVPPEPPMMSQKRRREEEEEDGMELLASKRKKAESTSAVSSSSKPGEKKGRGGSLEPLKEGDDPPPAKKIKMKLGASLATLTGSSSSTSQPNGKTGDGG